MKYIFWITGSFLVLILLLSLLTQTAFFKEKVRQQIIKQVSQYLNLEVGVEKLKGNFYSGIEFENVRFTDQGKDVFSFETLKVHYHLWALLDKKIQIDSISLESPQIHIWQNEDSTWSFNSYLKEQESSKKEKSEFKFKIEIPLIQLRNGKLEVEALSEMIPKQTADLNLDAGFSYSSGQLSVDLRQLNFDTNEPTLTLKQLSGTYLMGKNEMRIDNLLIRTGGSELGATAEYQNLHDFNGEVNVERIDSSEVLVFIPKIHLNCSPSIRATILTEEDIFHARVDLSHESELVSADIRFAPFSALTEHNKELPFSVNLEFSNFNLENWLELDNIRAGLDGTVLLEGSDLLHYDRNTNVLANLTNSSFNDVQFQTFNLTGNLQGESAQVDLDLSSHFGEVTASGGLQNLKTTQDYDFNLKINELNLEAFVPQMTHTILNTNVSVAGAGFDPKTLKARGKIDLQNSTIYNFQTDSLYGVVDWQGYELNIDSLLLIVPGAQANGKGTARLDSMSMNSLFTLQSNSLDALDSLVDLPVKFDTLLADVSFSGPFSRLQINGSAELFNLLAYDASLAYSNASFKVDLNSDNLEINTLIDGQTIAYQGFHWDSLSVAMNYLPGRVGLDVGLKLPDTLDVKLSTILGLGDTLEIEVPKFEVNTLLSDYYLSETLHVSLMENKMLSISDLSLLDKNNDDFLLKANGDISISNTNSLQLSVLDFDLSLLNRFLGTTDSIEGTLNTELSLSGSSRNPELTANIELLQPSFGKYKLAGLNGVLEYRNGLAAAEFSSPVLKDAFLSTVSVPLRAYLDSLQFVYSEPDSFEAKVVLDNLDIHEFGTQLVPGDSISGRLNVNVQGKGTVYDPQFYGDIKLENVVYQNSHYGIDYNPINASVSLNGNSVKVDTFLIRQKKGMLSLKGALDFDSTMIKGNLVSTSLQANASNFFLSQHRNYEILIDANTFVQAGNGKPEFGGKVKVLRSDIFLPALMKESNSGVEEDVPMLVEAVYGKKDSLATIDSVEVDGDLAKKIQSEFLDRLRGKLNIEIPRNTWVRSNDMRLELMGDIDIVKTDANFELFGTMEINRGYYLLYGKKLNVGESQITFEGGDTFDPTLNFKAEYVFRGSSRQKRYLELQMTGKLSEPELSFLLDDQEITENDGISVLLFGATSDEIGYSDQEGMIGAISSQAVASAITSQLSRTIGTQLKLDMIEITATDNWQSAAFVVGKYITNDIFVIYERGFGEVDGDEITPETITVEYELNDKLFLRLQSGSSTTSGFDVILKFEEGQKKQKVKASEGK